ncbi:hypothetical protein OQH61_03845 [Helicobacter sp. MIT 21-1697]|uniref:hypothetical protein n=1 Tax=Helicobacter sp. MIT 21-1697 TaxID=2993733 RepID=UPI00224A68CF|nr:hypothetical protein [Helicobacter sp. MIT 21-1697]MCX2716868.1 hypothetical protein [Helicobacter sp. MIT 21-1697]
MIQTFRFKLTAFICFFALFALNTFAKSYIISPLPLPQQEIINIDTRKCSNSCLFDFFAKGQFFSFVAFFDPQTNNTQLRSKLSEVLSDLGIFHQMLPPTLQGNAKIKLALLMPKKIIGRYSASSIDTILAYLMARGNDFVFEIFDTGNESAANLRDTYAQITQNDYDFVIAILTENGAQEFVNLNISLPTYLPTINKKQIKSSVISKNLIFGGIDYEAQIELLLSLAGGKSIATYNDNSFIGRNLGKILKNKSKRVIFEEVIDAKSATTITQKLGTYGRFIGGNAVFFNTPVVKTGLIASQLALSKQKPDKLLSTQINFNPSLLLLIQKSERKNLFIANIINNQNQHLVEYASLLGGDLRYDWVNYSTAIGVEQLIASQIAQNNRFFKENVKDSQVEYINKIFKSDTKNFYEY